MIILPEIAQKIENILNGADAETSEITRPFDFEFRVATQGYHLDHIIDKKEGKNFIPVFIETMGGQFDAVKGLKRATITTPITIYFPIRFKEVFYYVNEFLNDCFVGTHLNYGELTGKCLSNVSVATYGEIQDIDLKEFIGWVGSTYRKQIDVMEKYMSMTFTLYLTTSSHEFVYGNQVSYELKMTFDNVEMTEKLVWTSSGTGVSVSPISQQLIDNDNFARNTPNIINYNKSIMAYVKDNAFWRKVIEVYNNQELRNNFSCKLVKKYDFGTDTKTFVYDQVILSMNENVALGELISFTITFGDGE